MSIYVDPLRVWGGDDAPFCFRHKPSCHMYADTISELHSMAKAIGLQKAWFQADSKLPHYDLVASKRSHAIRLGAISKNFNHLVEFMEKL